MNCDKQSKSSMIEIHGRKTQNICCDIGVKYFVKAKFYLVVNKVVNVFRKTPRKS